MASKADSTRSLNLTAYNQYSTITGKHNVDIDGLDQICLHWVKSLKHTSVERYTRALKSYALENSIWHINETQFKSVLSGSQRMCVNKSPPVKAYTIDTNLIISLLKFQCSGIFEEVRQFLLIGITFAGRADETLYIESSNITLDTTIASTCFRVKVHVTVKGQGDPLRTAIFSCISGCSTSTPCINIKFCSAHILWHRGIIFKSYPSIWNIKTDKANGLLSQFIQFWYSATFNSLCTYDLSKLSVHSLRHTAGVIVFTETSDILQVAVMGNWSLLGLHKPALCGYTEVYVSDTWAKIMRKLLNIQLFIV